MSTYITLGEVEAVVSPLVTDNDIVGLINRAASRLYTKGATPGMTVMWQVGSLFPLVTDAGPNPLGNEVIEGLYAHIPIDYSAALFFTVDGVRRSIIPSEAETNPSGYDLTAFIDCGLYRDPDIGDVARVYKSPVDNDCDIRALVRRSYREVFNPTDVLPFQNISAVKLAVLATVYEDVNDLERAGLYWDYALGELESDSQRFRGPQKLNVAFYDEAASDVTQTIN